MPDWQERITRQTDPAARVEHALRYAALEPLLARDRRVVRPRRRQRSAGRAATASSKAVSILVGADRDAVAQAHHLAEATEIVDVVADLAKREEIQRVSDALRDAPQGHRLVTCFGVIERLATFSPLLDALIAGAGEGVTVVLSVPNDAFAPDPETDRKSVWGPGAFEELRRLLPAARDSRTRSRSTGRHCWRSTAGRWRPPTSRRR